MNATGPTHVVLSLGSNIDKEVNISEAVTSLQKIFGHLDISPIYETSSVGFSGPTFFNLVVGFHSTQSVDDIRETLQGIEAKAGRVRGPKSFASRVLDIDIILYGNANLRKEGYNIPRDEIEKYAYVLKPLVDLYPNLIHPISGQDMISMWRDFDLNDQNLVVSDFKLLQKLPSPNIS